MLRSRATGATLVLSFSARCSTAPDPTAAIICSRRSDESWFCFEQPARGRFALAALGAVRVLEPAAGEDRFAGLGREWRALAAEALSDAPHGPPGSGVVALGGLAFARDGCGSPQWQGFENAAMTVPELSLVRRDEEVWLTLNLEVAPDDTPEELLERAQRRLGELRSPPLPLLDPVPAGRHRVFSVMPPAHYEAAVERAVAEIRRGGIDKVVLAREVQVHAPTAYDPGALIGVLREAFSSCYVFAVGRGQKTFIGASPELLVRREGQRASTVALAGSARRSADPAVDDHLGERLMRSDKDREENAIVARRIAAALRPRSVWVTAAPEPALVRVANIQHLATAIRAQLAAPVGVVELAGLLHPTPAVGGEPTAAALELIPALEGLDRGWYAGPVGWTDAIGDGEFCVGLRCALLRGSDASLYAGCGIVSGSDPAAELAETEVKLGALLPLLSG